MANTDQEVTRMMQAVNGSLQGTPYGSMLQTGVNIIPADMPGQSIASLWPSYEVVTPQYPQPQPYELARIGYRMNAIAYACIDLLSDAASEPPCKLYDDSGSSLKTRKELTDDPARALMKRPNPWMGEKEFWKAVMINVLVAGFHTWEIEFNNGGMPIALWPMRPDWCSFRRAPGKPLGCVRYQPYGLAPHDVPVERLLVFMEFDPLYPMLKGLSRTAVALKTIVSDNALTDFVTNFFQHGAMVPGVLKTQMSLQAAEAERIRKMWMEQHAGPDHWTSPAVMGSDVSYQPIQNSIKDMDFSNIDGRNETRMCQIYHVPPILIGAKVGLDRSTFSNYAEARKSFYQGPVSTRWNWLQDIASMQLLPHFGTPPTWYYEFDRNAVEALQEDKDGAWMRARLMAQANVITRDEARREINLDAIDNAPVFVGMVVKASDPSDVGINAADQQDEPPPKPEPQPQPLGLQAANILQAAIAPKADAVPKPQEPPPDAGEQTAKALTEWRKLALSSIKRGGLPLIDPSGTLDAPLVERIAIGLVDCASAGDVRKVFERAWPAPQPTIADLVREVRAAREVLEVQA